MRQLLPLRLWSYSATALFFALPLGASAQGLGFEEALRVAAERAPLLIARMASVRGAAALQASAAELPDPKLSVGIDSLPINGPDRGSLTRDNFTQRQIGWTQDVPNRAKRAARSDAALARTAREQALLKIEQLTVRREAGLAWLARYFADKRLQLFEDLISQQRLLQSTASAQLAAGKIAPADVSAIELEALALADRRDELQREANHAHAALRRWTGDIDSGGLSGDAPHLKVDQTWLQANIERSAEVAALTPLRAMADADIREAEAAKQGDWSWGIRYGKRGPAYSDFVSAQLTFDLPLSPETRQQPVVRAKQKELERINAERDEAILQQAQALDIALIELAETSSKLERLSKQTLPLAAQRSALTLAAYQSGRDKLASVLEARKQQTDIGLRALELQARQSAVQWRLNSIIPEQAP
jgi:outer membrane protein, heavy metal efflux system